MELVHFFLKIHQVNYLSITEEIRWKKCRGRWHLFLFFLFIRQYRLAPGNKLIVSINLLRELEFAPSYQPPFEFDVIILNVKTKILNLNCNISSDFRNEKILDKVRQVHMRVDFKYKRWSETKGALTMSLNGRSEFSTFFKN